ncbi:MAG: ribonuclease P protein component [Clostridia bacterium]|nr:ribonuclease P protein component [Clostridia bacterium]
MNYLRLKKQSDFQKLFSKGKRAFSPALTMVYASSKELKMGISIGKKHGKSVMRNRIKRLIREAFRLERENIKGNYNIVLIPKVREEYTLQAFRESLQKMIIKDRL